MSTRASASNARRVDTRTNPTMRAVAVRKFHANPELMDVPKPKPSPGEVLVRLTAASVNPIDWKIADGMLEQMMPHAFPLVLGVDGAGIVEEVGNGVSRLAVGDSVYGQFLHSPVGIGTYAEYATVPEGLAISRIPRSLSNLEAAAVPTAGMTALQTAETLGLAKGQTLLIIGATGGVGSFTTQIAASRGVRVIATARADAADRMLSLGAAEIIDYGKGAVAEQVRSLHPKGVNALLDLVNGAAGFTTNATLVRGGGIASSTNGAADADALRGHGVRGVNISTHPTPELLDRLAGEIEAGHVKVPIESKVSLREAPAALARSRAGGARGKTVIVI